jgi:integrase
LIPTATGRRYTSSQVCHLVEQNMHKVTGDQYTFHSLRHAAARRLWDATHDILAVQRLLGHKTLSQTHVYLQSLIPPGDAGPHWNLPTTATTLHMFNPWSKPAVRR